MKRTLNIIITFLLAGIVPWGLNSCKTAKLKDADAAMERGEYYDAAKIYRKVYNKYNRPDDRWRRGEIAFKMGRCYSLMRQGDRAAAAYQNALRYEWPDSMTVLYLAQAQQMNGDWNRARENYERFLLLDPASRAAQLGIQSCDLAPQWRDIGSRYTVKIAKFFNSRRADFCPMLYGDKYDQLYWTSSSPKATGDTLCEITGAKYTDVFVSKLDDKGRWSRPAKVEGDLNSKYDEGITSFSPDGSTMFLARAIRKADAPTGVTIATSQRSEASWSAPQDFEITADTLSSYGDPAVSPDGKWLYFSSDMPGGQGGRDLWRIKIDDRVGTLENLGDQINTPGDERFPYVRGDSVLYFASDGHPGFGGLDLYKATLQRSGRWFIENMGSPINSSGDDFGITFGQGESGYFSSNRKDARGYDHLYSFDKPIVSVTIKGNVTDRDEEPVSGAVIRIVGSDGSNKKAAANPDGTFQFDLDQGVSYVMQASAPGYLNSQVQFQSDTTSESATYGVDFVLAAMNKPQVIENIFYDFDKASLRPASKKALDEMVRVMKENPYVTIELSAHTDRVGSDKYNNALSLRRAQSVVNYLVAHGVDSARMKPAGYGKTRPKVVTKHINRLYPQFAEGDTLTVAYIDTLSKENQAAADQVNRRTEFLVLSTNFQPFAEDLKKMQQQEAARRAAEKQAELDAEQANIARAQQEAQEKVRQERQKAAAEAKKKADNERAARTQARNDARAAKQDKEAKKKADRKAKLAEQKAKRDLKKAKEKQKRAEKQAEAKLSNAIKRAKNKAKLAEKKFKQTQEREKAKAKKEGRKWVASQMPKTDINSDSAVVAARENLARVKAKRDSVYGKALKQSQKQQADADAAAKKARQEADAAADEAQRMADEEAAREAERAEKQAKEDEKAAKKQAKQEAKAASKLAKQKAKEAEKQAKQAEKERKKIEQAEKQAAAEKAKQQALLDEEKQKDKETAKSKQEQSTESSPAQLQQQKDTSVTDSASVSASKAAVRTTETKAAQTVLPSENQSPKNNAGKDLFKTSLRQPTKVKSVSGGQTEALLKQQQAAANNNTASPTETSGDKETEPEPPDDESKEIIHSVRKGKQK